MPHLYNQTTIPTIILDELQESHKEGKASLKSVGVRVRWEGLLEQISSQGEKKLLQRAEDTVCEIAEEENIGHVRLMYSLGVILSMLACYVTLGDSVVLTKTMDWYKSKVMHRYVRKLLKARF